MTIIKVDEYKGFRVGMRVKILRCPNLWASLLCDNSPLRLNYPCMIIIKEIGIRRDHFDIGVDHIAMTCGNYGWDLEQLVKSNNIESITKNRKEKLEKLETLKL